MRRSGHGFVVFPFEVSCGWRVDDRADDRVSDRVSDRVVDRVVASVRVGSPLGG